MKKSEYDFDWSIEPNLPALHAAYHLLKSSPDEALKQLKWLAEMGSVASMIYIGSFYKGEAGGANLDEVEKWYRRATDAGSLPASLSLGILFLQQKRFQEANDIFRSSASRNFTPSIFFLARMYVLGQGTKRDLPAGIALLEKIRHRSPVASAMLGRIMIKHEKNIFRRLEGYYLTVASFIKIITILIFHGRNSGKFYSS